MTHDAKTPVSPLAGPYGHPFHPILVTVPIGAWVASVLFDLAAMTMEDDVEAFAIGAYWLIGIGVLGSAAAAVLGFLDLLTIPGRTAAFKTAISHMALNAVVALLFISGFLWRMDTGYEAPASTGQSALSVVALVILGVSGWLGGKLAYRYGVRVASEEHQREGY